MPPLISIIIPVYNTGKALRRMLDSVSNQSFKDFEVILVDDGSTDDSGKICDEYAANDPRYKVIHQENKGVSAARNVGLDNATGEYIAFFDSDDEIDSNMLEQIVSTAYADNADLVLCDLDSNDRIFKCDLEPTKVYNKHEIFTQILPRFTKGNAIAEFCPVNKLFRHTFLKDNDIRWNENICFQEDLMFTVTVMACATSLAYVPGAFYHYIQVAGGLCSSYRENAGDRFIYSHKEFERLIDLYKMVNLDIANFNNAFLYNITYYIYRTQKYISDKLHRKQLIDTIMNDEHVVGVCNEMKTTATSFDRRIAKAITHGNHRKALWLINFVHSGKASKLQNLISKVKR